MLIARGGIGGGTGVFRGGNGGDGRIRLEANGGVNLSGFVNLDGLMPGVDTFPVHASVGIVAGPFAETPGGTVNDTGDGSDGPLDITGFASPVTVNTNNNEITDANGALITVGVSGIPGVFNWSGLVVPEGSTVRGVGANPLIMKVGGIADGSALIRGTIDVSGFDGGEVMFPVPPGGPLPGFSGAGGPGGGPGGLGGFDDGVDSADGDLGGFPVTLPDSLIDLVPPYDGTDGTGNPTPVPLATPAIGGGTVSSACDDADPLCKGGSGGGGGYGDSGEDADTIGAVGVDGAGGSAYGSIFFRNPLDGSDLTVGGGGGAGGGGNANSGGGGFLRLAVKGALTVGFQASILAKGGNAYQAANRGGNGGAGAGGGVHIQGLGLIIFETDPDSGSGPIVNVLGGQANLTPTDPSMGGYFGNGETAGGNGAAGRIRIESPFGINTGPDPECGFNPTSGVCPPPSVGTFATANTVLSQAVSLPYPVFANEGPVFGSPVAFSSATVNLAPLPQPPGTFVRVLYSAARESTTTPGTAGVFTTPVDDLSLLGGGGFLRTHVFLYSNVLTGAVPSVEDIGVDGSF